MDKKRTPSKARQPARAAKKKSKVLEFLVDLAEKKTLQTRFIKDPHETMKNAGITPAQRKAFVSGDLTKIKKLFPGGKVHLPPNTTIKCTLIVIKF